MEFSGPTVGFEAPEYDFKESAGTVKIPLVREGDLSQEVSVICYTRQDTARVVKDFNERPKTVESQISFKRFEKIKYCEVYKICSFNIFFRSFDFLRLSLL